MLLAMLIIPLAGALFSWFLPSDPLRRFLLVLGAGSVLVLALLTWVVTPAPVGGDLLSLDEIGRLVLTVTTLLFFAASLYASSYLHDEGSGRRKEIRQGLKFYNAPEATFTACLHLFLAAAVLVAITRHFGALWVGIETTTLVSAPLIYFHRHRRSLEATWKYLIICSVGIAFALVGNLLLDISMQVVPVQGGAEAQGAGMTLGALLGGAERVHPLWFKAAFVFLLIGYGTKMGVAPMHTWLPDAHSEAPSVASALLSGALLNCAFLGIVRAFQVSLAVDLGDFAGTLLLVFGFFSMLIAALFIVGQGDYKRMLAYSSIEHMGILLIGLGAGFEGGRGAMLHLTGHSLVKAGLFMLAGNILVKYHTKSSHDISGLARVLPVTGALWLLGVIAVCGAPPFSLFMSEFSILQGLLHRSAGGIVLGLLFLFLLGVIFVGMLTPVLHMCKGSPPPGLGPERSETCLVTWPSAALFLVALLLGLYMPGWLRAAFEAAAALIAHS